MKSIRNSIVFMVYENQINERQNKLVLQELTQLEEDIKNKKLKGIYISLKGLKYTPASVDQLVNSLNQMSQKLHIKIGLGDLEASLYRHLVEQTAQTYIKLYRDENIARLLLDTKSFTKKLKIVILNDDEADAEKISTQLTAYEHGIIYATNVSDYQEKVGQKDIDFGISQTKINLELQIKKQQDGVKTSFLLSRSLISNLPLFVDTAVDSLTMITALDAKKISHGIKTLPQDIAADLLSSMMTFHGDMDANFVLLFPRDLAKVAVEAMIGEDVSGFSTEQISDGIAEISNIIIGSTKAKLSQKNIHINFELPKSNTSLLALKNSLSANNGIWIEMRLADEPFYMFIIK